MLPRLMYYTLTTSKLLSCCYCSTGCGSFSWLTLCTVLLTCWSDCCLHTDLHTALKWLCLPPFPHFFPICRVMSQCMPRSTVFAIIHFLCPLASLSHFCMLCLTVSNSLASFMSSSSTLYALCASAICAHIKTPSLMTSSMSSNVTISLKFHLSCLHHLAHISNALLATCHIPCTHIL